MTRLASLAAALAIGLSATITSAVGATAPAAPQAAPSGGTQWSVTLVTGDRILVGRDAAGRYSARPAGESGGHAFQTVSVADHLYVVPSSVRAQVGSVLDPALFDVRALIEQGLDDAHTASVPVLVTQHGTPDGARLTAGTAGALTPRQVLPRTGVVTATVDTSRAGHLGERLAGAGVDRIWLDQQVHVTWDRNLEQLHAPQAWASGFDGTGVKVAVLDTGVDPTHPDLAGKIVASADFSGKGSIIDGHGHGTHCAALAVGTGAGNSGDRRGVAPGAELLVGKVLSDAGSGSDSQVLAGMEWAAAQGANVVSMSLGGQPTDGTDPLSAAVNRLTDKGMLFVIAAGNSGPGAGSVGAPGAADGALTVAAVDSNDQVASFSSRGPRTGNGALKPDVAAPGVQIISARAAGTSMGTPINDTYTAASGTSMATPQVAGAAAVLLQRHPNWTPVQLKAALAGTADPTAGTSPYAQGAGRINLAQAITATVLPQNEDTDFGLLRYPQTAVVSKAAGWRNDGPAPVTLDLSLDVRGPDGSPDPASQTWLSTSSVTVPAGGTAQVSVSADPRITTPGQHAGYLTATIHGTGTHVQTPVGFIDEKESYNLTVHGINRHGAAAAGALTTVFNVDDILRFYSIFDRLGADGTIVYRVPRGHYQVDTSIEDFRTDGTDAETPMVEPELTVAADTTLTLDARSAQRAFFGIDRRSTSTADVGIGWQRFDSKGQEFAKAGSGGNGETPFYLSPTTRPVTVGSYTTGIARRLIDRQVRIHPTGRDDQDLRVVPVPNAPQAPSGHFGVVDVGTGTAAEFAAAAVTGRIVVVRRGLPLPELAAQAKAAGAALLAVTNDQPDVFDPDNWTDQGMPAVVVDGRDAAALRTARQASVTSTPFSAFSYDLFESGSGGYPQPVAHTYTHAEVRNLAVIDAHYPAPNTEQLGISRIFSLAGVGGPPVGRSQRTEYTTPNVPTVTLAFWVYPRPRHEFILRDDERTYRSSQHVTSTWFGAPLRAGIGGSLFFHRPISRTLDTLTVQSGIDDGDGHYGYPVNFDGGDTATDTMSLYRNDILVGQTTNTFVTWPMSAEPAHYRLLKEQDTHTVTPLGTRSLDEWRFDSARPADSTTQILGLPTVDYTLPLDDQNRLTDRQITVTVLPQPGLPPIDVHGITVWFSTDDGLTWQTPRHTEQLSASSVTITLPKLAAGRMLSFRADTATTTGVTLTSTTLRAVQTGKPDQDRFDSIG